MSRIRLTLLGTLWVGLVAAAWVFLGTFITDIDVAWLYWTFSIIPAGLVAGVPFIIYRAIGDQ